MFIGIALSVVVPQCEQSPLIPADARRQEDDVLRQWEDGTLRETDS